MSNMLLQAPSNAELAAMPLLSSVQFFDQHAPSSINKILAGIMPEAIYSNFEVEPASGLNVVVRAAGGSCLVATAKAELVNVKGQSDITVSVPANATTYIWLKSHFAHDLITKQVDINSATPPAEIIKTTSATAPASSMLLAKVTVPNGAASITSGMLDFTQVVRFNWNDLINSWRPISSSLNGTSNSVSASENALRNVYSYAVNVLTALNNVKSGTTGLSRLNINDKHWVTENDGTGNFNIRVGHRTVNVDGIFKSIVTEAGTQFHIRFDNDNVPNGHCTFFVATGYENDGAVGDYITEFTEVMRFNKDEFRIFRGLLRASADGSLSSNGHAIEVARTHFNIGSTSVIRKASVERFVITSQSKEETVTLTANTYKERDCAEVMWCKDGNAPFNLALTEGNILYNGVAVGSSIRIAGKPRIVKLIKANDTAWHVFGLYLDCVAYQELVSGTVLIKEAINTRITNRTASAKNYSVESASYKEGDTLELIRSYSTTGDITVTLDSGQIYFDNAALGTQVRNSGIPHKLILEKTTSNNWLMRVERIGQA